MEQEVTPQPEAQQSQPAPEPIPAPQTGPSEDLKAKVEELERRNQGILRDLQQERERRKALEARNVAPSPTVNSGVANADADPVDQLLTTKFEQLYAERRRAEDDMAAATQFIAKEFGLKPEEVPGSPVLADLQQVVSEYGIRGNSMLSEARTAAELYKKRQADKASVEAAAKAKAEAERQAAIQQQAPEPARGVPGAGQGNVQRVSRSDVAKMSIKEYSAMVDQAKAKGVTIRIE